MIEEIRKQLVTNEFDYVFLKSALSSYKNIRDQITKLIRHKEIIRVKKGLYVLGPKFQLGPIHREILANLIYGPSYISLDFALSFYDMIPERIETVTSITNKKNKSFKTPLGNFTYKYISAEKYSMDITQIKLDKTHNILIATREKAIVDKLSSIAPVNSTEDMQKLLIEDLRIDMGTLLKLRLHRMKALGLLYKNKNVDFLYQFLKET